MLTQLAVGGLEELNCELRIEVSTEPETVVLVLDDRYWKYMLKQSRIEDPARLMSISRMQFTDDGFEAQGVTLVALVSNAYDLPATRILGFPRWANGAHLTIHARTGPDTQAELQMANGSQRRAVQLQLSRSLLAERFRLALHVESRITSVLVLTVVPGGPKLKMSGADSTFAARQLIGLEVKSRRTGHFPPCAEAK